MTSRARQLQWLIAIRLVVVTSVVVPYFLMQLAPQGPEVPVVIGASAALPAEPVLATGPIYSLAGAAYGASLLYLLLLRILRGRWVLQAYIQFGGDLLLVTLLVYFFGGTESPFSIFYLVVIAVATAVLKRRVTSVATLAFVLYATLLVALHQGWLPLPDGTLIAGTIGNLRRLAYNLGVHLFAFYAVAFLTWALGARGVRAELELAARMGDLADLETLYRDVIQSITSGLLITDDRGVLTSLNRAAERILGRRAEELVGRPISDTGLFGDDDWQRLWDEGIERGGGRYASEIEVVQDRAPIYVGYSIADLTDAAGKRTGAIVIFQDLTPWRQLEDEMRLKDRMAAVGKLAAGLAHEIGNPLAAISGSVQMLSRSAEPDGAEAKLLGILLRESQRLDRTIKRFLDYARPGRPSAVPVDVAHLLAEHFELLSNSPEVSEDHQLDLRLEPESAWIETDPDGLSQVFWNLSRNALKAMPRGGTLRVTGRLRPDVYEIEFHDTGRGMSDEERAALFHPFQSFFGSTGLGMAIVYRIVQDHGGRLAVDSREGAYTRITIELPLSAESPRVPASGAGEAALAEGRGARR